LRKFHGLAAVVILRIAIARCRRCRKRERVLPCDILPGKITGAAVVFAAIRARIAGARLRDVAAKYGVCILTVRLWVAGVGSRFLGLLDLLRHRAIIGRGEADRRQLFLHMSDNHSCRWLTGFFPRRSLRSEPFHLLGYRS